MADERPTQPRFMPIADVGNSVLLPGMQSDILPGQAIVPPDLKPIPASGDMTGTIFPLADPVPMPAPPEPLELAAQPMFQDQLAQGIPQLEMLAQAPPEFPEVPPAPGAPGPGMEPLAEPLPTAVPDVQRPWPPWQEPVEAPPWPPPESAEGLMTLAEPPMPPIPEAALAMLAQAPELIPAAELPPLALPQLLEALQLPALEAPAVVSEMPEPVSALPAVEFPELLSPEGAPAPELPQSPGLVETPLFPEPAALATLALNELPEPDFPPLEVAGPLDLPAPTMGEPLTGSVQSGLDELTATLKDIVAPLEERSKRFADERGRLRAPVPATATGEVLWAKIWGEGTG